MDNVILKLKRIANNLRSEAEKLESPEVMNQALAIDVLVDDLNDLNKGLNQSDITDHLTEEIIEKLGL